MPFCMPGAIADNGGSHGEPVTVEQVQAAILTIAVVRGGVLAVPTVRRLITVPAPARKLMPSAERAGIPTEQLTD